MENFAEELNLKKSNIKPDKFERNLFNYSNDNWYTISWYLLTWTNIKPKKMIDTTKFFDWWKVDYLWDEAFWSFIQFMKDDLVCYYSIAYDQQIPYELLVWEDENWNEIDYEEEWENFHKIATYSVELRCWKLPKNTLTLQQLSFDAYGQEPFWNASFRWSEIALFDVNWVSYYFPQIINKIDDDIILSWYHINWILKKEICVDNGRWADHEYSVDMNYITDNGVELHYEWCADAIDLWFTPWEEGSLENFIEKTHYNYTTKCKVGETSYSISEIVGNYMHVNFYVNEENGDYHSYQVIMEKVDNEWKVLFEWDWYSISDEKCEELNQYDNNLMEMFFLTSCPRW